MTDVVGRIKAALKGETSLSAAEYAELIDAGKADLSELRAKYDSLTDAMLTDDNVIARRQQLAGQIEAATMRLGALQMAQRKAIIGEVQAEVMAEIDRQTAVRWERVKLLQQLSELDQQREALLIQIKQREWAKFETPALWFKQRLKAFGVGEDLAADIAAAQERLNEYAQQQEAKLARMES